MHKKTLTKTLRILSLSEQRMKTKSFATIFLAMTLAMIIVTASIPYAIESQHLLSIPSSGKIGVARPLHVEGRYIKNDLGEIVVLRGVNKEGFEDDPTGWWNPEGGSRSSGLGVWNASAVAANLDRMKSWGINVIRSHHAINSWLTNRDNYKGTPTRPYKDNVKDVIRMAGERGIYYIFDAMSVVENGEPGHQADPLPFPPYIIRDDIITSKQDFVDYWASVAAELKQFPNVIFELWNEPHATPDMNKTQVMTDWFDAAQQAINAIRATGADQLIIVQWDYGAGVNLDYPNGAHSFMDWITQYPLTDPMFPTQNNRSGNIVYSTHQYRGNIHRTIPSFTAAWTYDELKLGYETCLIDWVGDTLNKPLIIGEIGGNMWKVIGDPVDGPNELAYFYNSLTIFNEWELGYLAYVWTVPAHMRHGLLTNDVPWVPPPNEAGNALINAIAAGSTITNPRTINGYVTDVDGNNLAAVTVTAGSVYKTITDSNGYYTLLVENGTYTLTFSKTGYQTFTIPNVNTDSNPTGINATLTA